MADRAADQTPAAVPCNMYTGAEVAEFACYSTPNPLMDEIKVGAR